MKKKIFVFMLAAVMTLTALTVCSGEQSGTVSTDGSTSMEEVIGVFGEAFMQNNNSITFTYNPTGSGSGIKAVQEGSCDIGLSSRNLKEDEKASGDCVSPVHWQWNRMCF